VLTAPETEEPQPTKAPDLMAAAGESIAAVKDRDEARPRANRKPSPRREESQSRAEEALRLRSKAKASK
jgi:hypothetical protein